MSHRRGRYAARLNSGVRLNMGKIDAFLNKQTDWNWGWFPFLFLRPPKSAEISNSRLAAMAGLYGLIAGTMIYLYNCFRRQTAFEIGGCLAVVVITQCLFFIIYKFTYAGAWNRRARRLATSKFDHGSST